MPKLSIGPSGIRKTISKITPIEAIFEYVWNGFDAGATEIEIAYNGQLGGLAELTIKDNGSGISFEKLEKKFGVFLDSEKNSTPGSSTRQNSDVRGKRGFGRLTFNSFSSEATWKTTYLKGDRRLHYEIKIKQASLNEYAADTVTDVTNESQIGIGTEVIFKNIFGLNMFQLNETLDIALAKEYCWYLELNKDRNYKITVNGEQVKYESMVTEREKLVWIHPETDTRFDIKYVSWSERTNDESSRYYYLNQSNEEVFTETTRFNKKGDGFYNSVYVTSVLFRNFNFLSPDEGSNDFGLDKNRRSEEFRFLQDSLNKLLIDKRKPFLIIRSELIIRELELAEAFPEYNKKDPISLYQHDELVTIVREIYQVDPQIFTQLNKDQKKVFVRFLDLILQAGERDRLFEIIGEIVNLTPESRTDLANVLKNTKLKNIITTMRMLEDRYKAVEDLKQLVFKTEWNVYEVEHIQAFIDKNYWIFGEQYRLLTSTEPDFQEALSQFQHFLYESDATREIDHPDSQKEMDIFAVRKDIWDDRIQGIIVELKRPNITISQKQLAQIERYMGVIIAQPEFNDSNMSWEFHLVGRKYDDYIEYRLDSEKGKGEPHLVMSAKNFKIYVKTWSEVIGAFDRRHEFLMSMLNIQKGNLRINYSDPNEIIFAQASNSAVAPPQYDRSASNDD